MSDTEGEKEVKIEGPNITFLHYVEKWANEGNLDQAVRYAQLSLAESAATYLAMLQGSYAKGIGEWLWEPALEAGYTAEDYNQPTSAFWTDVAPIIMERVLELRFPEREIDD